MPVIIPPTYLYFNSDEDDGSYGGGLDPNWMKGLTWGMIISIPVVVVFMMFLRHRDSPSKIYEKELKYGTEQILNVAHNDAVNSANTINIDEYEFVSPMVAKCDSARYARKITRFIKRSGTAFLGWKPDTTIRFGGSWVEINYVLTVDENRIAKDTNFLKLSNGYKRAVEQLAVQRRISKQK